MPVRIVLNAKQVEGRIMGAWEKNLGALSGEILADCNEYCKEDQHTLINSSMIHSQLDKGKLIWATPYAARQYWEIRTSLTPGRTWKWCETATRRWKSRWQQLAEKGLKDNL